jgi:hypothetical protein
MINGSNLTSTQKRWLEQNTNPNSQINQNPFSAKTQKVVGHLEALKETAKEDKKLEKKLNDLVDVSDNVLFRAKAVFPFDFFPNEVTIDVNQVNILYNDLLSQRLHSIAIKNIFDVSVNSGVLFASLQIVDVGFKGEPPIEINYLKKPDASEARQIIQGLVIASKQELDLSRLDIDKRKLEALGEATGIEESY